MQITSVPSFYRLKIHTKTKPNMGGSVETQWTGLLSVIPASHTRVAELGPAALFTVNTPGTAS